MSSSQLTGRVALCIVLAGGVSTFAQTPASNSDSAASPVALDRYVFSASRTPQDPKTTPSSVSLVSFDELRVEQVPTLSAALAGQPGVIASTTGAVGGQTSVFIRGANQDQTLFVVDGVRLNDRAAEYLNFLGAADLHGLDRIEVLRGPQSTLYGSSALGGVILLNTAHGAGPASGTLSATGGSFGSYGAAVDLSGSTGGLSYAGSLQGYRTDNDRPDNEYKQASGAARLEYTAAPGVIVGGTFRGLNARYEEPGSRLYSFAGVVQTENTLATMYGDVRPSPEFDSRLTLASHLRQYTYTSFGFASPQSNNRYILDWQNTWTPTKTAEIVAGTNFERSRYVVDGAAERDRVAAGYISTTLRPAAQLVLTGGLRYDNFRSVGSATTGRAGVAWLPTKGTKLRATYGTGFNAPSTADRYGIVEWGQLPNPNLEPEKSRGWDAGIDQELADGAVTLSATYFQNKFRNLFEFEYTNFTTFEGHIVNRAHASTQGVELAAAGRLTNHVHARATYTYLSAYNDDSGARLNRRPRHTGDAEVHGDLAPGVVLGVGGHFVSDNVDGTSPYGGYATVRVFASWQVRRDLTLKARVENALNRKYEEVYGYPALPVGAFGSVEWKW
jgi:vitamin B12 transporter